MTSTPSPSQSRLRRTGLPVTLWAFGFATTLLLIGLWGRSASTDEATIAETASAIVTSDLVRDRVTDWVEAGLADAGVPVTAPIGNAVERILAIDEVRQVVDGLVAESVAALVAEDAAAPAVDVAAALAPASALIAAELGVEETVVRDVLARVEPIDLSTTNMTQITETAGAVHGVLTLIVVLAAVGVAAFGSAAIALSEDRTAMVRGLAVRVALSAFSFAILFQIGGWLMDPEGGRSPVLSGGSILIRSNGHVFLGVAAVAA
ncbi:MAG: hypothetical protein EHM57_01465, partial [Actinobacteria bacterium]